MVEEQFMPHHQRSELKDHSSITTHESDMEQPYMLHPPPSLLMGQYSLITMHTDLVEPYIIIIHRVVQESFMQ